MMKNWKWTMEIDLSWLRHLLFFHFDLRDNLTHCLHEVERIKTENEILKRENELLKIEAVEVINTLPDPDFFDSYKDMQEAYSEIYRELKLRLPEAAGGKMANIVNPIRVQEMKDKVVRLRSKLAPVKNGQFGIRE